MHETPVVRALWAAGEADGALASSVQLRGSCGEENLFVWQGLSALRLTSESHDRAAMAAQTGASKKGKRALGRLGRAAKDALPVTHPRDY